MKIKIFCEAYPTEAESKINNWLTKNPGIKIEHIKQTQVYSEKKDGALLTISVFYQTPDDGRSSSATVI